MHACMDMCCAVIVLFVFVFVFMLVLCVVVRAGVWAGSVVVVPCAPLRRWGRSSAQSVELSLFCWTSGHEIWA